jgi:hypothetical protein
MRYLYILILSLICVSCGDDVNVDTWQTSSAKKIHFEFLKHNINTSLMYDSEYIVPSAEWVIDCISSCAYNLRASGISYKKELFDCDDYAIEMGIYLSKQASKYTDIPNAAIIRVIVLTEQKKPRDHAVFATYTDKGIIIIDLLKEKYWFIDQYPMRSRLERPVLF